MARATKDDDVVDDDESSYQQPPGRDKRRQRDPRLREQGISCMLNTEVGAVLAVIRRPTDLSVGSTLSGGPDTNSHNSHLVQSLQSLRSLIFHPLRGSWRSTDPAVYLSPFLEVIQSDDVPAAATGIALSVLLKILRHSTFGDLTPGAREAIHAVVFAITNCRLERTDPTSEDAVLMRILQVLAAVVRSDASALLTDHAVCTIVNSCFQIVQQSAARSDLLQRTARNAMHDLIQAVYSRLPDMRSSDGGAVDSSPEAEENIPQLSYTAQCMVDIFHFLCSLLNAADPVDTDGGICSEDDVQLFALELVNSTIELGGESISQHPGLLHLIQDDLFHHLICHGTQQDPLILSMICSTVLNLYNFLRR